jgi:methionyl-tRNA formyltransferase
MDTGDIVVQKAIEIPDGISYDQLAVQCAILGGGLLARGVWDLYNGLATPVKQDETKADHHPFPSVDDFVVNSAEWDARHVYNFIRGIDSWGEPITLQVSDTSIRVKEAISYSHMSCAYSQQGEEFWIPCRVGSVRVK